MSSRDHRWWTTSGLSARAKLGTSVIGALLVLVVATVWVSPQTAERTEAAVMTPHEQELAEQVAELQAQLDAREAELDQLDASDAKAAAERAAGQATGRAKAATEREAAAQSAAAKAEAERAAASERGREKAAAERAAAQAKGQTAAARARAAQAERDAAAARAQAAAAKAANGSGSSGPIPAARPTAPSLSSLIAPDKRQYGLYTTQAPFNWAEFDDVGSKVGVSPTMVGYFQGWDGNFRADAVTRAWQRGMMPLLTWESRPMTAGNDQAIDPDYSLPVIIGDPANGVPGRYDDYLHQYAKDIVALGLPLGIRLDHEMNGSWYPWGERAWGGNFLNGNRKGDYVKMWQHVHDIFEAEGANQFVVWIWAPNIVNALPDYGKYSSWYMKSLYPGDEYVDWVGLSGYYRPPYRADQTATFSYTFDRSLAQLREVAPGKPILLAEIGASEIGGNKPAWIADMFTALTQPQYDDIIGFAWFNQTVTTISGGQRVTNDWRITSRRDSLAAFVAGITNPAAGFVDGTAPPVTPPDPEPTPTPSPTQTAEPTPTPSPTPTAEPTPTASPSASPEPSPSPSASTEPEPSPSPSGSPTAESSSAPPDPSPDPSAPPQDGGSA